MAASGTAVRALAGGALLEWKAQRMTLPNGDRAIIDPRKLTDYALSPDYDEGKHTDRRGRAPARHLLPGVRIGVKRMNRSRQPKLLDIVAVLHAPAETEVEVGDVGTVIELLPPDGLEIEFLDRDGKTRCVTTLTVDDVLVLNRERTPVG